MFRYKKSMLKTKKMKENKVENKFFSDSCTILEYEMGYFEFNV